MLNFEELTPDRIITAVESATGRRLTGMASPFPSYINRVYELQDEDGRRLVAKFYRPGRWSPHALRDEHDFVLDCVKEEIPVVAPMALENGDTLATVSGISFAVFPKRGGREMELSSDEEWNRVGALLGRIHVAAQRRPATARIRLHPELSASEDIRQLVEGGHLPKSCRDAFMNVSNRIMELSAGLFEGAEPMRIHGDFHRKNLLHRPGEGIMVIDFDDMMTGPAVQDLWLLLPDHANRCRKEIDLLLRGYEQFREFDEATLKLIEPLRAMRIIYFLAWCGRQSEDYQFRQNFPNWGTDGFWKREISDLEKQLQVIYEHLPPSGNTL